MQVNVFKGRGNWYGFTATWDAADLPIDHGPWTLWKSLDMNRGETPRWGISTDAVLDAIQKGGTFATETRIEVKKKEN